MRMKATLLEGKSEAGANHLHTEGKMLRWCIGGLVINVNIKMYIFDHLRMYIFAILPLDRYIFLSDKIFL